MASYVAIDFETANETRASACSLGVMRVDNASITSYWTTLIDPEAPFAGMNTYIHGIDGNAVRGAPTFPQVLERLLETADGVEAFVAHSAAFDMHILAGSAARYDLELSEHHFACTRVFARHWWPDWPSYSLPYVVNQLGIANELGGYNHHLALWDAAAAMLIAEHGLQGNDLPTWAAAATETRTRLGSVGGANYRGCITKTGKIDPQLSPDAEIDPAHALFGRTVCFTGELQHYVRREAAQIVVDAGGQFSNSVTQTTDLLVVGTQDLAKLNGAEESNKMRKATKMAASGHHIEIIDEADFYRLLTH